MSKRKISIAGTAGLLLVGLGVDAAPALADPALTPTGAVATFEGRSIDLTTHGLRDVRVCIVWRGTLRCFRSDRHAQRELGRPTTDQDAEDPRRPEDDTSGCAPGDFCAWTNRNFAGSKLIHSDESWRSLAGSPFDQELDSWHNNQFGGDGGRFRLANGAEIDVAAGVKVPDGGRNKNSATDMHG